MDKKTTIGFVLIGLVLLIWMWVQTPPAPPARPPAADSSRSAMAAPKDTIRAERPAVSRDTLVHSPQDNLGTYFSPRASGEEKIIVITTDLYTAEITTKGGLIRKWELSGYKSWDGHPVQLVDFDKGGDFGLLFTSGDGKLINTRSLYFDAREKSWTTYRLRGDQSVVLELSLPVADGRRLAKRMTFTNGKYTFETEFDFVGMGQAISNFEYQIVWENGLQYAERNSVDESNFALGYAYSGGELIEVDAGKNGETTKRDINGVDGLGGHEEQVLRAGDAARERCKPGGIPGGVQGGHAEQRREKEFRPRAEDAPDDGLRAHACHGVSRPAGFRHRQGLQARPRADHEPRVRVDHQADLGVRDDSPVPVSPHVHPELRLGDHRLLDHHQARPPAADADEHEVDEADAGAHADDERDTGEVQG
jgi:YidC/Oxa1 family membrane protein insertase